MSKFEGFDLPNTTPVPDVVFDELLGKLTGNELKVLLYIIRRTYGFGKNADAISLSQFRKGITTQDGKVLDKGCGIEHNRTILVALTSLETKGYIISQKRKSNAGDDDTTIYKLNFKKPATNGVVTSSNYPSLPQVTTLVTSDNDRRYPTSLPVVTSSNTQETVIQETVQQETEESTFPAVAHSPTASSHDEDAHALSPVSSEPEPTPERISTDDAHPVAFSPHPAELPSTPTSQLSPGHDSRTETSEPAPPIAEPPIASRTTTEPPKPARKPRAKKAATDLESVEPLPKPARPADDMPWNAKKALLWADYFRGYTLPVSKSERSDYKKAEQAAIRLIQRDINERNFVAVFRFMRGVTVNLEKDAFFRDDWWPDNQVADIWHVEQHYVKMAAEIKRKRLERNLLSVVGSPRSEDAEQPQQEEKPRGSVFIAGVGYQEPVIFPVHRPTPQPKKGFVAR